MLAYVLKARRKRLYALYDLLKKLTKLALLYNLSVPPKAAQEVPVNEGGQAEELGVETHIGLVKGGVRQLHKTGIFERGQERETSTKA